MEAIAVRGNGLAGWRDYADKIGFVPDPMLLRAGEIFLNGLTGADRLGRDDVQVAAALNDNVAGIMDFFDLVVTRDVIPLIGYDSSFDRFSVPHSLEKLLGARTCRVTVGHEPYDRIKEGALRNLAGLDFARLAPLAHELKELDALRYDWKPSFDGVGEEGARLRARLAKADAAVRLVSHFLLGGFIFGGFAQASGTMHYIQPKRSRMLLGLTAQPGTVKGLSRRDEEQIFAQAEDGFRESGAEVTWQKPIPPVLPYLVAQGPEPRHALELLERALKFRETGDGRRYRAAVDAIRGDGVAARRVEDVSAVEREAALAMLAPYSRLDPRRSGALQIKLKGEVPGLGAETTFPVAVPPWMRIWWNDNVGFGTVRTTLRRMWMADQSYQDFAGKLLQIWRRS